MQAKPTDVRKGDWVEITREVLPPDQRAANLPQDTAKTPYTLKVRGIAEGDGQVGRSLEIRSVTGRRIEGIVVRVHPDDAHNFGRCVPELIKTRLKIMETMRGGLK